MALTDAQLKVALQAEIKGDPGGLGYAGVTGNEEAINAGIAALLNAVGGDSTDSFRKVLRERVESWEIVSALSYGEYISLTQQQRDLVGAIVSCGQIDPRDASIRTIFGQLFGNGTDTRVSLNNLQYRAGSRAENLFGPGFIVQVWDVARARAV